MPPRQPRKIVTDLPHPAQQLIDVAVSIICVLDRHGRILAVNRAWREFFDGHITRAKRINWSIGADYLEICRSQDGPYGAEAAVMAEGIAAVLAGEADQFIREYPCFHAEEPCWFVARVMRLADGRGKVAVSHENITLRKHAEARMMLATSLLSCAGEGITVCNAEGAIVEVNDSFTRITGYGRDEVIGRNPRLLKSGRQGPDFYGEMWRRLNDEDFWRGEIWNRRKDGHVYAEMLTISVVRDAQGAVRNYVAMFSDITAEKEHARQIAQIAHFDPLTGLPNRTLLSDRLNQEILHCQRRRKTLAVVLLDLDGFKDINDRHGHDVGDELLIAVARSMRAALRDEDSLARIGGDEFVAVLGDLDRPQDCQPALARLLQAAAGPIVIAGLPLALSASIGVTLYPGDGAEADLLLRHAGQAMVAAKQAGRNRYHMFDVAHDAAVAAHREGQEEVRHALGDRQFLLHYQPKVNMRTGEVVGLEALIRWRHPSRGLLAPADFLPLVEETALGVQLGDWVIETVLAQIDQWRAAGAPLPVSVNVGARQLQQPDFVTRLGRSLADHPLVRPEWLELEILETSALQDMALVSAHLRACKEIGVRCALDDFGTGYSSLAYLRRLPAESIKIDQTFVRDMLEDADDLLIVEGVVGLARAFQRRIIAEGVESVRHGELLLSLGCELAQGFGIARPMPADQVLAWVRDWRPDPGWLRPSAFV